MRRNKFNAKKVVDDCITFDSKREHKIYCGLKILWTAGEIQELHVHPQYPIVWPGTDKRICMVELDFRFKEKDGTVRVIDVKGVDTPISRLKRKLVEAAYGITVEVVK